MRKLDRTVVAAPPCLAQYRHGVHNWGHLTRADKDQIRACLEQMQGRRCAYCEGALDTLGQHIEHFHLKHRFPHLTFDWTNLYWSCDQRDSCGRYKDHSAGVFDPGDLIKPCIDDPDKFFRFRSDGTISVRPDLSERDQQRAHETLRVFNLQPKFGRLRNMRKAAAATYIQLLEELDALTTQERKQYVQFEIQESAGAAFSTVIRHLFEDAP